MLKAKHCRTRSAAGIHVILMMIACLVAVILLRPSQGRSGLRAVDEFVRLDQNYPNPFNGTTEITYSIPAAGHVSLKVVNMLGEEVQTVIDEDEGRNEYRIRFDGSGLPSGQYTYTLVFTGPSGTSKISHRMYLVK